MGRRALLVGLIMSVLLLMGAGAAHATTYPNGGTTPTTVTVAGETVTAPTADPVTSGDSLPFTGGDVAGLAAIGGGAIAVGLLLSRRASRRRA
jgi:hypothetical protein